MHSDQQSGLASQNWFLPKNEDKPPELPNHTPSDLASRRYETHNPCTVGGPRGDIGDLMSHCLMSWHCTQTATPFSLKLHGWKYKRTCNPNSSGACRNESSRVSKIMEEDEELQTYCTAVFFVGKRCDSHKNSGGGTVSCR